MNNKDKTEKEINEKIRQVKFKNRYTPEDIKKMEQHGKDFVEGLNKSVKNKPVKKILYKILHILFIIFAIIILIPLAGAIGAPFLMAFINGEFGIFFQVVGIAFLAGVAYWGYKSLIKYNKENKL